MIIGDQEKLLRGYLFSNKLLLVSVRSVFLLFNRLGWWIGWFFLGNG